MTFPEPRDSSERLEALVEEYIKLAATDASTSMEPWRALAGDQWDDFQACVNVARSLGAASDLLGHYEVTSSVPETIQRFEIVRLVAEGGFSRVFLGFDPKLKRTVALKVLKSSGGRDALHAEALGREAHALAQVKSDYVVQILELIDDFESGIIVTEFIPGPTLEHVIKWLNKPSDASDPTNELERAERAELMSVAGALAESGGRARLTLRIAEGLAACHAHDVLHRDLKPSNVLVPSVDRPRLIDFGLAHADTKQTLAGFTDTFVGTAAYLAPEQIDQRRVGKSVASEIYALGVLAYEFITLEHPWDYGIQRPGVSPPPHALLSREMEWVLQKALSHEPEDRYTTVAAFAQDIRRALDGDVRIEATPSLLRRGFKHVTSRAPFGLKAALSGGVLIIGAAWQTLEYQARRQVSSEISRVAEDIDEIVSPTAAAAKLAQIASLADASRRADSNWLLGWAFTPLRSRTEDARARAKSRIETLVRDETHAAMRVTSLASRKAAINEIKSRWSSPIVNSFGLPRLARCEFHIEEPIVFRRVEPGSEPTLTPAVNKMPLAVGFYRARSAESGRECEFEVLQNQLVVALNLRPIPDGLSRQLVTVRGTDRKGTRATFQMTTVDLTEEALAELLPPSDAISLRAMGQLPAEGTEDPSALMLSGFYADFVAGCAGMRLPTRAELLTAKEHGLLGLSDCEQSEVAYWCSMKSVDGEHAMQIVFRRADGGWPQSSTFLRQLWRDGYNRFARLRLARSAVSPEE